MTSHTIQHTLFVAGMVLASSVFAGQGIVKCIDLNGQVTLTDQPCQGTVVALTPDAGAPSAIAVEPDAAAPVAVAAPPVAAPAVAAEPVAAIAPAAAAPLAVEAPVAARRRPVQHSVAVLPPRTAFDSRKPAPSRLLAGDVATLKAAAANMRLHDAASASMRQQRLAGPP